MAKHRLYIANGLSANVITPLDAPTTHYVLNVLRLRDGEQVEAFDGQGHCYLSALRINGKRNAQLDTSDKITVNRESPLHIELLQVLSRGEKMDWTIQKAVELGVSSIRPLTSKRCNVKLDTKRALSRHEHWQTVIHNACEQCGRNYLPQLHSLADIIQLADKATIVSNHKWLLHPDASEPLISDTTLEQESISILIGPEGGLSNDEMLTLSKAGFKLKKFGPRILRTETAAIAAIAAIQSQWGDMK